MGDNRTSALPDGTDTVIQGAARIDYGGPAVVEDTVLVTQREIPAPGIASETSRSASQSAGAGAGRSGAKDEMMPQQRVAGQGSIAERIRSGREQLSSQAGEKARGLVTQGLERTSEALANVARMVGDTAPGIEERLGGDYADYARRAAGSIENVANTIAAKDPDELIEDTRNFVRNSPGLALAGATILGFVVARLVKTGLSATTDEDDQR